MHITIYFLITLQHWQVEQDIFSGVMKCLVFGCCEGGISGITIMNLEIMSIPKILRDTREGDAFN